MFRIEDELHAAIVGDYSSREDAMAELRRLADVPWDESPNAAPCSNSANCGRSYEIIEYATSEVPWRELSRGPMLEIFATGTLWI